MHNAPALGYALGSYIWVFPRYNRIFPRYNCIFLRYNCIFLRYNRVFLRYNRVFLRYNRVFLRYNRIFPSYIPFFQSYTHFLMKRYSVPHKPSVLWEHGEANFLGRFGDRKNNPATVVFNLSKTGRPIMFCGTKRGNRGVAGDFKFTKTV